MVVAIISLSFSHASHCTVKAYASPLSDCDNAMLLGNDVRSVRSWAIHFCIAYTIIAITSFSFSRLRALCCGCFRGPVKVCEDRSLHDE